MRLTVRLRTLLRHAYPHFFRFLLTSTLHGTPPNPERPDQPSIARAGGRQDRQRSRRPYSGLTASYAVAPFPDTTSCHLRQVPPMLTRRDPLQAAALPSRPRPVEPRPAILDGDERYLSRTHKLMTGISAIDFAAGGISIGGLTSMPGHCCNGKSSLARAMAQSLFQNQGCCPSILICRLIAFICALISEWPVLNIIGTPPAARIAGASCCEHFTS